MNKRHNPESVAPTFGPYSHAVEVPPGSRMLFISGEVGVLPDGVVPDGIEAQAEACWNNIIRILADADMEIADLVKITTYLKHIEDAPAAGEARARFLGNSSPASFTGIIDGFVKSNWLIEIEAVAAKPA